MLCPAVLTGELLPSPGCAFPTAAGSTGAAYKHFYTELKGNCCSRLQVVAGRGNQGRTSAASMEFFHFFILNIPCDFLVSLLEKNVRRFVQSRHCCTELQASKASSSADVQPQELQNWQKAADVPSVTLMNSHAVASQCSCKGCQQVSNKCLLKLFESLCRIPNPSVLTHYQRKRGMFLKKIYVNVTVSWFFHRYSTSEDHVKEVMLQFRGLSMYFIICHPEWDERKAQIKSSFQEENCI